MAKSRKSVANMSQPRRQSFCQIERDLESVSTEFFQPSPRAGRMNPTRNGSQMRGLKKSAHTMRMCCRTSFVYGETLGLPESDTLEYKGYALPLIKEQREQLKKTICGFLNNRGGIILLGVGENLSTKRHTAVGNYIPEGNKQSLLKQLRSCAEHIEPDILYNCKMKIIFAPVKSSDTHQQCMPARYITKIKIQEGINDELYCYRSQEGEYYVATRTENEVLTISLKKEARKALMLQKERAQLRHSPRKLVKHDCLEPECGQRVFQNDEWANRQTKKPNIAQSLSIEFRAPRKSMGVNIRTDKTQHHLRDDESLSTTEKRVKTKDRSLKGSHQSNRLPGQQQKNSHQTPTQSSALINKGNRDVTQSSALINKGNRDVTQSSALMSEQILHSRTSQSKQIAMLSTMRQVLIPKRHRFYLIQNMNSSAFREYLCENFTDEDNQFCKFGQQMVVCKFGKQIKAQAVKLLHNFIFSKQQKESCNKKVSFRKLSTTLKVKSESSLSCLPNEIASRLEVTKGPCPHLKFPNLQLAFLGYFRLIKCGIECSFV